MLHRALAIREEEKLVLDDGPAETSAVGDGRKTRFRGIEVLSVLNLHARLELRQIEEVAPVHGKIFNLLRVQYALYGRLLGIHLHRSGLHLHHLAFLSNLQLGIAIGSVTELHRDRHAGRAESRSRYLDFVLPRDERARVVGAGGIGRLRDLLTGGRIYNG